MVSGQELAKLKIVFIYQKIFFIIKLPHAHLQYICNIPAHFFKDVPKTLGELISQSIHYQPLLNIISGQELTKLKMV